MQQRKARDRGPNGKMKLTSATARVTLDPGSTMGGSSRNTTSTFSRSKMTDAQRFNATKGSASAYQAATELLRNFTDRRVLYDRGALVAQEMHDRVRAICEAEDAKKIRLFLPSGNGGGEEGDGPGGGGGGGKLEDEVSEASQKMLGQSGGGSPQPESERSGGGFSSEFEFDEELTLETAGNQDINLKQLGETEIIESQVIAKQDKLEQLRSFQRAMAEIMDQFEEEKTLRENLRATGRQDATSDEYEKKARDRADRVKEAMRANFEALIADNEEVEVPPDASHAFSIHNLSTAMELLGKSIATICEATDEICVTSTFKTEGEPASIFLCVKALRTHVPYSRKTHEQILGHMTHYELGEKAILEGGTSEINRLRENFLQCKDTLIVEEQKLKAAEDHREALRKRLLNIHQRCDMWENILLQRDSPRMYVELLRSKRSESPADNNESPLDDVFSPKSTHSAAFSSFGSLPHEGTASSNKFNSPVQRRYTRVASVVDTDLEEAYETQVARSWGNPYVQKARQYEQACLNRMQSRMQGRMQPTSMSNLGTNLSSSDPSQSLFPAHSSLDPSRASPGPMEDEETLLTSYARRLALLQSLSRTIPASTFIHKDGLSSELSDDYSGARRRSTTEEQVRKETRLSIQRLIRYTAQYLQNHKEQQSPG